MFKRKTGGEHWKKSVEKKGEAKTAGKVGKKKK